jgi:hypothetical protein
VRLLRQFVSGSPAMPVEKELGKLGEKWGSTGSASPLDQTANRRSLLGLAVKPRIAVPWGTFLSR